MRIVHLSYTLRDDVDIDGVEAEIRTFVAAIAAHDPTARYTSYRDERTPRRYAHVGAFASEEAVAELQRQPFFGRFAAFLRERCAVGPTVTPVSIAASTEAHSGARRTP